MILVAITNGTETREMTCSNSPTSPRLQRTAFRQEISSSAFQGGLMWIDRCSEPFQKNIFRLEMDNLFPTGDDTAANKTTQNM